jgi:hypothetical protein
MVMAQMRRATRPMTVYSGSSPLEKKKDKVGCELVDVHASAAVVFHVGEAVGERQGELRDGVGTRLSDVVA